jgi:hypothetical protein
VSSLIDGAVNVHRYRLHVCGLTPAEHCQIQMGKSLSLIHMER